MAKVYFAAAVVVGGIAIALFLLYNVREPGDLSSQKTDKESAENSPVIDPPQKRPQDRQGSPDSTKTKDGGKGTKKDEKSRDRETSKYDSKADKKDNEKPKIPKGHLKYLGEHGSPIITGEIEEIDFVPNGKDFYTHFARKRRPLIMRGAISHWPAVKHWANETYLRENYGDVIFDVQLTKKYETILPIKKTMTLNEYLNIYKKENVYLDCPFPQSKMTRDILVPYCLQCDEFGDVISSTHLLFSNGNTSSSLHYDGYENLLSVISGTKEILVANYTYAEYFYNRNYTTVNIEAPIDPEAVDLIKYPKLAEVSFHKVTIHAGDILYIPQTWWHHVRSFESPNIAISLWFGMFKDDESQEPNTAEELDETEMSDPLKFIEKFGESVNKAPETIECLSQNRPISEVFWPKESGDVELPKIPDGESWIVTLNSGYKMPMKGFGTAGLLNDSEAATLAALKTGYKLIDTAQVDGYNETAVGCALKSSGIPRQDIFLVSKVLPKNMGFDDTIASLDQTLEKLQTSYVDLMLIHAPDCEKEEDSPFSCPEGFPRGTWRDCWKGLEELVKQGKVRSIGVSNFEVKDLKELMKLATIPPAVVQNFFNPLYQDKQTRKYCQENNIKYMGFSTLGNMYVREGFDKNPVLTDEGIQLIAQSYDASPAQVVLKWALESDVIIIPQSRNPNHIETNFHLHQIFLSDKDKEYFEKLDGKFEEEEEVKEETAEKQEPELKKPVRNKDIIDKLDLKKKVNPDDATIYVSSDDQYIYALDAKTGELMWKYGTAEDGGSRCAFSVDESVVYCGTDDHHIRAFDRLDGTLLWKFEAGGAVVSSTRVGNDGTLYVGSLDGYMYAVNKDGSLKWKRHLGDQIWSSPALRDGGRVVFVGSMAEKTSNVFALDGETGEAVWDLKTQGPVFSSPALSKDEKVMFVCSFDYNCYAFDSETGKIVWVFEADGAFQSSPVVSHTTGTMFVASTEGNVFAVSTKDGKLVWKHRSKGEYFSSPFPAPNGLVYIGSGIGEILALNQSDGQLVWKYKTEMTYPIYSTPKMTKDGVLYVGGIDGYLYALRSEDGQVVWKFKTNGPLAGTVRITEKHNMPTS